MTRFYAYTEQNLTYVGELDAIDIEVAKMLANEIWPEAVKITSLRLTFNRTVAN